MSNSFASTMGRALELTRAGAPMDATRVIQDALRREIPATYPPEKERPAPRGSVRPTLRETVDAIAKLKADGGPLHRGPAPTPPVPPNARYEARRHVTPHGARDYKLFIPSPRAVPVEGLVVMLHGCTQTADDFAIGTQMNDLAEKRNLMVAYPQQSRQANQMGCWNWFRTEDQARNMGEPAILTDLAMTLASDYSIPRHRVFAAGLSAGGAMAAILGETYPEVFSAVAVHSGLAPGSASDMAGAFAAMRSAGRSCGIRTGEPVRSIVFHGAADTTVAPGNADRVIGAALGSARVSELNDGSVEGADISIYRDHDGHVLAEKWMLQGLGHAWSGGSDKGSYTHPSGPDVSTEIIRFVLEGGGEPPG